MLILPLVLAVNLGLHIPSPDTSSVQSFERAVLTEINRARTNPSTFVRSLQDYRSYYRGNVLSPPGAGATYLTREGLAPVDEAIAFVGREGALAPLEPAPVLAAAAGDHQAEQALDGAEGHAGGDGSTPADRVRRRGGGDYVGELIAYGSTGAADVVRQLVVDDGVADRGHRRLLFDASLRFAGVSCGGHPVYRYMCVITVGRTPDGRAIRERARPL